MEGTSLLESSSVATFGRRTLFPKLKILHSWRFGQGSWMIKDKSRPRTIYIYIKFISFDAVTALTEIYPNETRTDMCNDLLQGGSGDKGGKLKKKQNTNRRSKSQIHTQQQLNKLYTLK